MSFLQKGFFSVLILMGTVSATVVVNPDDLVSVEVEVKNKKKIQLVEVYCFEGKAGKLIQKGAETRHKPYADIFRKLRKKFKGQQPKPAKFTKIRQLKKKGDKACAASPPPTPTPEPTPTPIPSTCFTAEGDLTPSGYVLFGIPTDLEANQLVGAQKFTQYACDGCHQEYTAATFDQLRAEIIQPPMEFFEDEISNQDLAHLMSYLSRFRLNECD